MTETNENITYPVAEKQMVAVGVPFQMDLTTERSVWITNYAYWQKQVKENGPQKPLIGRMNDKQFQVYIDGEWENKDLWKDYSEEYEEGGKIKKRKLFDNKFEVLTTFKEPVDVSYYNKDAAARVTEACDKVWVRFSKNLLDKIKKEINHPRALPDDWYVIKFDKKAAPADMYTVEPVSE